METTPASLFSQRRTWIILGVVVLFLAFLGLGLRETSAPQPIPGNPAPEIELQFFDGYEWLAQDAATLTSMQGEIIVLNFWASWCAPCRQEAATLQAVSEEYKDKGVTFLGVAWSDTETQAYKYLEEFGITYPNAPDLSLDAQEDYRFKSVPETFIIDASGVIQVFHAGPVTAEQLRSFIDAVVEG